MLYNEKIEALISAALADGVLTEKEKQVLFKKAQAEGIDLDEFEMVLDARLVELEKAEKAKAAASAPKSNKLGDVKKCPACGAIVQSYQGKCSECGYEFEDIEGNKAVNELSALLRKAKEKDYASIIRTFPIPNTKANLIEFMTYLQSNTSDEKNADTYASKLQECIIKAQTFFHNDAQLMLLVSKIEEAEKKRLEKVSSENRKGYFKTFINAILKFSKAIVKALPWILIVVIVLWEWNFLYGEEDWAAGLVLLICVITIGALGYVALIIHIFLNDW